MMKQFTTFSAIVPSDFMEKMIAYWMGVENMNRKQAIDSYYDEEFVLLNNRIVGGEHVFIPDLGYNDESINGTLCFEELDNNFVIPINILVIL